MKHFPAGKKTDTWNLLIELIHNLMFDLKVSDYIIVIHVFMSLKWCQFSHRPDWKEAPPGGAVLRTLTGAQCVSGAFRNLLRRSDKKTSLVFGLEA